MNENRLTRQQAVPKIKQYCAYQERCHSEVRNKLYGYGLHQHDVNLVLSQLIEENYLNEQRFAKQYASGKFRLKHWGKTKIKYSLKGKQVSDYCIRKALDQLEDEDYKKAIQDLAVKKWELLKKETNKFAKRKKLQDFLLRKGFEPDQVREVVNKLYNLQGEK